MIDRAVSYLKGILQRVQENDIVAGTLHLLSFPVMFLAGVFYGIAGVLTGVMALLVIVAGSLAIAFDMLANEMKGGSRD